MFQNSKTFRILLVCIAILIHFNTSFTYAAPPPVYVWWEAENAARSDFGRWGMNPEQSRLLSGGAWASPKGTGSSAAYKVAVPSAGVYNLWTRKFWKHGPFKWRFDRTKQWQVCGRDIALHDSTYLQKFIEANWVFLGQAKLSKGTHEFEVTMTDKGGAFDCFLLIKGSFIPRGTLKPGEKSNPSMNGFFAWEPDADPFSKDCPIDLRFLNEKESGMSGFVKRKDDGFTLGDNTPVRFWIVQADSLQSMRDPMIDFWARRLAKYGVNLVRLNMLGMFNDWKAGNKAEFRRKLDRLHYAVSALKKEGIYCYLGHVFWHTHVKISEKDGFPGYGNGTTPIMLLFFDPKMQAFYKKWVKELMNTNNPYTRLPMSKDPGVAFFEIQNESSLLFWTFKPENTPEPTKAIMEKTFYAWVKSKYGSIKKAHQSWNNANRNKDKPDQGRLSLLQIWFLTADGVTKAAGNKKRASDQLQFMVEWQKTFYTNMIRDLKKELGFKNLITCSNWQTADPKTLGVLELYTYTPGDAVCRNVYYGVRYDPKPKRFYAVDIDDTYIESSALNSKDIPSPLTVGHVDSHPYMITENNWTRPSRFRAEWPFLVAGYGSMMGVDGWTFFALDTPVWVPQMNVWEVNSPCILGQFPAAALLFRKGYVKEAKPVLTDILNLKDLYNFKGSTLFELSGKDALWEARIGDLAGGGDKAATIVDNRAFFVGRVVRKIIQTASQVKLVNLAKYIDNTNKRVKSMTGELEWDYKNGIATINSPKAQGACGFLNKVKTINLKNISIECSNEYGSILVVSMDDKPLSSSKKILIQAVTEDLPYGFKTRQTAGKKRITALGGYPLMVKTIKARVTLKRSPARAKGYILDHNGYISSQRARTVTKNTFTEITLSENSLYTLIIY